jgi:hypothetical protein
MATVQELSILHRRYTDTSHRFRAAWTFHQFIQSLEKSVLQRASEDHSNDFQALYAELKEISQSLNASEGDVIRGKLDWLDQRLDELIAALEAEDTRVAPYFLRQFFRRVKNYDEKILTQLAKFYVYAQRGDDWPHDRLDKVDFLLTRLSEEDLDQTSGPVMRDPKRLGEVFQALWALLAVAPPAPEAIASHRAAIEEIRVEVLRVESLDQLNEGHLVRRYRDLKHGLGNLFFEPELALAVQEANLTLKGRIQKLYRQEERRIAAEYQRVFELEREVPVTGELDGELSEFHQEIERFEKQLERDEFKLEDLASIRQRVRSLLPRLTEARALEATGGHRLGDTGEHRAALAAQAQLPEREDVLGEPFRRMVAALGETMPDLAPERVVLLPEIFPLRLEPREVVAFRRYYGSGGDADRDLEQFLLEAAALRIRVNEEAQEIAGIMDETSVTGEAPVYSRARLTAKTADAYLWRFQHVLSELQVNGNAIEGRQLQLLRMRLMRDYSGLWLLAYKPFLSSRRPPGGTMI